MNESTLNQLKIIVERAVRPVRASRGRKQKIREELLAHVCGVFEEESATSSCDEAALERAALRFGNPVEVTRHLQESIPASDNIVRCLEGRPDESMLRGALRFAWIEAIIASLALGVAFLVMGWTSPWSGGELVAIISSSGFLPFWLLGPVWLIGIALAAHWLEGSLHCREPLTGWPRIRPAKLATSAWGLPVVRAALIAGGISLLALVSFGGFRWPLHPADWNYQTALTAVPFAGFLAAAAVVVAWVLVQTVDERRRRLEEWSRLPLEPISDC